MTKEEIGKVREMSQYHIIGEPVANSWDTVESQCLSTFGGGHRDNEKELEAYRHGMQTIFNVLRDEFQFVRKAKPEETKEGKKPCEECDATGHFMSYDQEGRLTQIYHCPICDGTGVGRDDRFALCCAPHICYSEGCEVKQDHMRQAKPEETKEEQKLFGRVEIQEKEDGVWISFHSRNGNDITLHRDKIIGCSEVFERAFDSWLAEQKEPQIPTKPNWEQKPCATCKGTRHIWKVIDGKSWLQGHCPDCKEKGTGKEQ